MDRLNLFYRYLVPNLFDVKTFLAAPIVPINVSIFFVVDICCDWLWGVQINHIGFWFWVMVILPPSYVSVRPPFLHLYPSKNEVLHVPIHKNKSTQHRIFPVYCPNQKSTHISPILELYVRQIFHWKLPRCRLDNTNEYGWWLHWTCLHSISKWCLFVSLFTKAGAYLYFYLEIVDHRLDLSPNSKFVARIIIPNHLIISPLVVPFNPCLTNFWEV